MTEVNGVENGAAEEEENVDAFSELEPIYPPDAQLSLDADLMQQILAEKKGEPNKYASYWEMDDNDIDEPTEDDIQNNPVIRTLWAAENGRIDIVKDMLSKYPNLVTCQDSDGYSPLHRASYNGHLEVMLLLLKEGADVNSLTNDKWTPLHSTASWGQYKAAHILLSHGGHINAQTKGGQTPLHLAACPEEVSQELIEMFLMDRRLDPTLKNNIGETARDLALRSSRFHWMFEMCDEGVNELC